MNDVAICQPSSIRELARLRGKLSPHRPVARKNANTSDIRITIIPAVRTIDVDPLAHRDLVDPLVKCCASRYRQTLAGEICAHDDRGMLRGTRSRWRRASERHRPGADDGRRRAQRVDAGKKVTELRSATATQEISTKRSGPRAEPSRAH